MPGFLDTTGGGSDSNDLSPEPIEDIAERANAARRVMVERGLHPSQLRGIRGFADTLPRITEDPSDPRKRRVSIVVQDADVHPDDPHDRSEPPPAQDDPESEAAHSEPSGSH